MKCTQCGKDVLLSISGLGKFCSWECRKLWKSNKNKAFYARQSGEKTTQPSSSQNSVTISACNNGENNGSKTGSETSSSFEEFGGQKWYLVAKKLCCNFDVRVKEGFCSYLFNPKLTHKKPCNRCELGQGLMRYDNNRRIVRRTI